MNANNTVEITMERFEELLRKEVGFEYRKAELSKKEKCWLGDADIIIFGVEGKEE